MADQDNASASGLTQPPPAPAAAPPPPPAAGANLPLTDLLTLARAILRETGELPPVNATAAAVAPAAAPPATDATPGPARGPLPKEQKKFYKLGAPSPFAPPAASAAPPATEPTPISPRPIALGPLVAPSPPSPVPAEVRAPVAASTDEVVASAAPLPGPPAATAAPADEEAPGEVAAVEGGPHRRPRPLPLEARTAGRRRSFTAAQRAAFFGVSILFTVLAFGAGLGFGRLTKPSPSPNPAPPNGGALNAAGQRTTGAASPASEAILQMATMPDEADRRALDTINEALVARQTRDWTRAATLFERAGQESPRAPGVTYRLAETALRRGDAIEAETLASRAQALGQDVDAAFALRAVVAQRAGKAARAMTLLESASRVNPYEGRYYLYQAQLLRQGGKLQEAMTRLQAALLRAEEPAQLETITLFLRLTQLELGQEGEFAEELAARLAQPAPPSDALVLAAARDLQHERFTEAAGTLRRALAGRPPGYILLRLNDIFFRRYADRPEIAPIYAQLLPRTATAPLVNLAPPDPTPPSSEAAPAATPALAPTPGALLQMPPGALFEIPAPGKAPQ